MDLAAFFERKKLCDICTARKDAKQVVIPVLNNSRVWILGRNPGRDENEEGVPFIGRGGRMLDNWFDILGYSRSLFLIENPVACYTEKDRPPTRDEKKACAFWLTQELELVKPKLVITLGNDALQFMLMDERVSVVRMHAMLVPSKFYGAMVFPTFHPGHCLRNPYYRQLVEQGDSEKGIKSDLEILKGVLKTYEEHMTGSQEKVCEKQSVQEHFDRR